MQIRKSMSVESKSNPTASFITVLVVSLGSMSAGGKALLGR